MIQPGDIILGDTGLSPPGGGGSGTKTKMNISLDQRTGTSVQTGSSHCHRTFAQILEDEKKQRKILEDMSQSKSNILYSLNTEGIIL